MWKASAGSARRIEGCRALHHTGVPAPRWRMLGGTAKEGGRATASVVGPLDPDRRPCRNEFPKVSSETDWKESLPTGSGRLRKGLEATWPHNLWVAVFIVCPYDGDDADAGNGVSVACHRSAGRQDPLRLEPPILVRRSCFGDKVTPGEVHVSGAEKRLSQGAAFFLPQLFFRGWR